MTPIKFFDYAEKNKAKMVDLKFTDLLGTWQHCTFPVDTWDEKTFVDGVGFDGSSIRGWQGIHVSDMLAVPDPDTVVLDPFFREPTVSVIANIVDPITKEDYTRDPRHVARKGISYLKETKIADTGASMRIAGHRDHEPGFGRGGPCNGRCPHETDRSIRRRRSSSDSGQDIKQVGEGQLVVAAAERQIVCLE